MAALVDALFMTTQLLITQAKKQEASDKEVNQFLSEMFASASEGHVRLNPH
jgi:hypothetical protein